MRKIGICLSTFSCIVFLTYPALADVIPTKRTAKTDTSAKTQRVKTQLSNLTGQTMSKLEIQQSISTLSTQDLDYFASQPERIQLAGRTGDDTLAIIAATIIVVGLLLYLMRTSDVDW